jgi:ubiquinol-cytochrome c reductase cytochrome c1 subunit
MRLVALTAAGLIALAAAAPARAQELVEPPHVNWSFDGPFGTFDRAALQRGFQVYNQVCSNCHSMNLLSYRDLSEIGLSEDQVKAIAASKQIGGDTDDSGQPIERAGLPSDHFKAPFPNEKAARAANGGALPPDQSLLVNAREGTSDYVDALLQGYEDPPKGVTLQPGQYYNKYMAGHMIAMPPPLAADAVEYADGTKATLAQEASDVTTFLTWAANPEMEARKRMGVKAVLFLTLMSGLTYAVKKKVWKDVH